jgi:hypothetical protein
MSYQDVTVYVVSLFFIVPFIFYVVWKTILVVYV